MVIYQSRRVLECHLLSLLVACLHLLFRTSTRSNSFAAHMFKTLINLLSWFTNPEHNIMSSQSFCKIPRTIATLKSASASSLSHIFDKPKARSATTRSWIKRKIGHVIWGFKIVLPVTFARFNAGDSSLESIPEQKVTGSYESKQEIYHLQRSFKVSLIILTHDRI